MAAGTLYLVPTPIGNPRDITLRAVDVLRQAGIVAAEDTRHTRSLLHALDIAGEVEARLLSYHDHNEESRTRQLLAALHDGVDVALVSDAGMPLVNDPGYRVVVAAIADDIRVCPLPGASATVTALVGSGLPVHHFQYVGFLPRRAAARRAALERLRATDATLIFFEAPHRLLETVDDMRDVLGDRPAALARNLTKADERFLRGPLSAVADELREQDTVRGEHTLVVAGAEVGDGDDEARAMATRLADVLLRNGVSTRQARDVVREVTGLPRNQVYELVRQDAVPAYPGPPQPNRGDRTV